MRYQGAAVAASTLLVSALFAVPAATATERSSPEPAERPAPAPAEETCAVGTEPVEIRSGRVAEAAFPEPTIDCFPTFAEAVEFATGGDLSADNPAALERTLDASGMAPASSSWVLLGIEYANTGYSGASLVLYGSSGSGCGSSRTYGFPTMPTGWNNRVSSARSYAGCASSHYTLTSYRGSVRTCQGGCSTLGTLNNNVSSIVFRPLGTYG